MIDKSRFITYVVWILLAVAIGFRPLEDPDLGWHLVGGLYMFENGWVPTIDPIGAEHNVWISYSWLIELLCAVVYSFAGFTGLLFLQVIVVCSMFLAIMSLVYGVPFDKIIFESNNNLNNTSFLHLGALIAAIGLVIPVAYLRPQIFSVIFFALLLLLIESNRKLVGVRFFVELMMLTCLWANVHVYWIFAPITVALFAVSELVASENMFLRDRAFFKLFIANLFIISGKVILLCLCGLISPYGVDNVIAVFQYAFCHDVGYSLITEFQAMSWSAGISCVWYWVVVCGTLLCAKECIKKAGWAECALWLLFCAASYFRVKFLPLFGVITAVVWVKSVVPCLLSFSFRYANQTAANKTVSGNDKNDPSIFTKRIASVLVGVFIGLYIGLWPATPIVPDKWSEIFNATDVIRRKVSIDVDKNINILNEFTNGGWVGFGLWRGRALDETINSEHVSSYKVAIDGRTLVMGEKRLLEYRSIASRQKGWCDVVSSWNVPVALLSIDSAVHKGLIGNQIECGSWKELWRGKYWVVLSRSD